MLQNSGCGWCALHSTAALYFCPGCPAACFSCSKVDCSSLFSSKGRKRASWQLIMRRSQCKYEYLTYWLCATTYMCHPAGALLPEAASKHEAASGCGIQHGQPGSGEQTCPALGFMLVYCLQYTCWHICNHATSCCLKGTTAPPPSDGCWSHA